MKETEITNYGQLYKKYCCENDEINLLGLWHYTSADGFLGIIGKNENEAGKLHFWFTRSDNLNDESEGKHILDLFKQVCSNLLKARDINKSFYDSIYNLEIPNYQFINYPIPPIDGYCSDSVLDCVECYAYICCFSLTKDSLDMWRSYTNNDGYALKLSSQLFEKQKKYESSKYDKNAIFSCIYSYKVIYNDEEKKHILQDLISDSFSLYKQTSNIEDLKKIMQFVLKVFQFRFKKQCYSIENEYRFVFYLPYKKPEYLENEIPEVKNRVRDGISIPYIDVTIEHGVSYLSEVMISPFIKDEGAATIAIDHLKQCKLYSKDCKISKSQLSVKN